MLVILMDVLSLPGASVHLLFVTIMTYVQLKRATNNQDASIHMFHVMMITIVLLTLVSL
jgi:hypothetical protein